MSQYHPAGRYRVRKNLYRKRFRGQGCSELLHGEYIRLPELLAELALARVEGTNRKLLKQYKQFKLLILDEWLLYPLKDAEGRYKKASTIFCSQFEVGG